MLLYSAHRILKGGEQVKTKKLKFPTERELGWLILRKVCQFYSSGGISIGRSPQSRLLDAWMTLEKGADIRNMDDWTAPQLEEEAKERVRRLRFATSLEPFSQDASDLTKRQLGYCILHSLIAWYRSERAKESPEFDKPSKWEMELLELALDLLYSLPFVRGPIHFFDARELILASDDRLAEKVKRDWKRRN
jgi:hypothetical protein